MRISTQLLVAAGLILSPLAVFAGPIQFDGTAAYTQNFQSMTTTTNSVALAGLTMTEVSSLSGGGSVTGWYIYGQGWTTAVTTKYVAGDTGGSSTGGFRQLIDTQSTVGRALGSQGSSSAAGWFGLVLQNTSASTIDNLAISYDAVMNRNPATTANPYPFSYQVSSTGVNVSTQTAAAAGTFNNALTTNSSLGFNTPSSGTGAPGTQGLINPLYKISTVSGNLNALGWGAGQYLYLAWNETDNASSDATAGVDNFSISAPVTRSLVWSAVGDATWNTSTANWTLAGSAATFQAADIVTFSGTGATITLSGALAPTTMNVTNASGTYTFNGATAGDKITGTATLTKSGNGVIALTSDNDYTGGTNINGGTLSVDGAARLGTGAVSLNGGTLTFTSSSYGLTNALSVGSSGGTLSTAVDRTLTGAVTLGGVLTKSGAGALTLAAAVTSSTGGTFSVAAGDLILGQASGLVKVFGNGTLTGNLVLTSGIRLDVDGGSTLSGSGLVKIATTGALLSNTSGDIGGTISAGILLNSGNTSFTAGSWSGLNYTSGSFITTIGGTKGPLSTISGLTIGVVSGNADVDFSNSSTSGGGGGRLSLAGVSTYTGMTTINTGAADVAGEANIKLLVSNPLPIATGVIVGTKSSFASGALDLNGFNLQVAYLADGPIASSAKVLTIRNESSTSDSILTLGGSSQAGMPFGGIINDGPNGHTVSVVKMGANTQSFTNAFNSYSGGTTLTGGVLQVATGVLGTGQVAFNGGTLAAVSSAAVSLANNLSATNSINIGNVINNGEITLTGMLNLGGSMRSVTLASDAVLTGVISAGGLTKAGNGKLTLSGTNTYAGGTNVSAGTLVAGSAGALGTGAVTINGGNLQLASFTHSNAVTVTGSGKINGLGQVGALTIGSGGTIAPALGFSLNPSATITATSLTLAGGAIFEFNVLNASDVQGTGYSSLASTGALDLSTASLSAPVIVKMISNSAAGVLGNPVVFSAQSSYSFTLINAGSLNLGSNTNIADVLFLDLTQFTYSNGTTSSADRWAFSYDTTNNSVMLSSIPEPSTYGLGLGILALGLVSLRKRRKLV